MKDEKPGEWIPKEYRLPDTIEEIEAGRPAKQRNLFDEQRSNSREAVLRRLTGIPGVQTADQLRRKTA